MAGELFKIDQRDLKDLKKFYKNSPRLFARATAGVLNSFAFGTRREIISLLSNRLIIRNEKFLNSSVQVDRASGSDINRQRSKVGSVVRSRFTGWIEQQTGKTDNRTHKPTIFARRGNKSGQVPRANRLATANVALRPEDFDIKAANEFHRTQIFLQMVARKSRGRPFYIRRKHKKLKRGIYKIQGGKIKKLHNMDKTKKKVQTFDWINLSRKNYFNRTSIRDVWGNQLRRLLKLK